MKILKTISKEVILLLGCAGLAFLSVGFGLWVFNPGLPLSELYDIALACGGFGTILNYAIYKFTSG